MEVFSPGLLPGALAPKGGVFKLQSFRGQIIRILGHARQNTAQVFQFLAYLYPLRGEMQLTQIRLKLIFRTPSLLSKAPCIKSVTSLSTYIPPSSTTSGSSPPCSGTLVARQNVRV